MSTSLGWEGNRISGVALAYELNGLLKRDEHPAYAPSHTSVERIYLRQRCFDALKPRVAAVTGAQYGFSRRNKIPRCSAYAMGKSNPVPASGL